MGQDGTKELDFYLNSDTLLLDLLNENTSTANRVIGRLPHPKLKQVLLDARIKDVKGNAAILRKRLKNYIKNRQNPDLQAKKKADAFKYLPPRYCVVIDFEATCDKQQTINVPGKRTRWKDDFPHEIIEFPAAIVDLKPQADHQNPEVVDIFHRYVKPEQYPLLSEYCKNLTNITQKQVDNSEPFAEVLEEFNEFLVRNGLNPDNGRVVPVRKKMNSYVDENANEVSDDQVLDLSAEVSNRLKITPCKEEDAKSEYLQAEKWVCVTDGPFDFAKFLRLQCEASNLQYPKWARRWINLKRLFASAYDFPLSASNNRTKGFVKQFLSITEMLEEIGLTFEGRQHCGIDDTKNIARILMQIRRDGATPVANEQVDLTANGFYSPIVVKNNARPNYDKKFKKV